jgi:hypothetical protein
MPMRPSRAVRRRRAARGSGRATVPFAAFLAWSPSGTSPPERASIALCQEVKRDGRLAPAVALLRLCLPPDLGAFFSPATLLVPVPGHAPQPPGRADQQGVPRPATGPLWVPRPAAGGAAADEQGVPQPATGPLWVPRRLCEELLRAGLGARWEPLLVRRLPVTRSARAGPGGRPSVRDHYESLAVRPPYGSDPLGEDTTAITLVDDVITKGATLLAGACRLAEAFPRATVRAFALLRTQNPPSHPHRRQVFRTLVDPVCASISLSRYGAWRHDP